MHPGTCIPAFHTQRRCCCVCSATPRIGIVTGIRRVSHAFEAVSKISEYPHSRIQIPGTPRVDKVFRGPKGRCCCFCFVGRVMPAGGPTHTGGQGDGSHDSDFPSVLRLPPPQAAAVDSILLACVHALGPLPGYPTTPPPPPLRFEPVGTQCTVLGHHRLQSLPHICCGCTHTQRRV